MILLSLLFLASPARAQAVDRETLRLIGWNKACSVAVERLGYPELGQHSVVAPLVCHRIYKRGFFCFTCGHDWTIFRLQPRFDVPHHKLEAFAGIVRDELDYIEGLS